MGTHCSEPRRRWAWAECGRRLVATAALLFVGAGCRIPATSSDDATSAAVDRAAFAFVPVRSAYVKPDVTVSDESARRVENALRVEYAPIECRGKHARVSLNLIQGASRKSPDLVRRNGRQVYVVAGGAEPTRYAGCRVVGSHLAGAATFLSAFAKAPTSVSSFAYQQALWLAIREPWGLDAASLSASFHTFLAENLGAVSADDRTWTSLRVLELDRTFNPCSGDKKQALANDPNLFTCLAGVSYANTLAFATYRDKILGYVAKAEGAYLTQLAALAPVDGPEVDGMRAALEAQSAPSVLELDAVATPTHVANATASVPPASLIDAVAPTPALSLLKIEKSRFVSMLGLGLMGSVSDVVTESNPRVVVTPPPLTPELLAAGPPGTAAGGAGWRKVGDTFLAKRGDVYVTARVVPGAPGASQPVFRTGAWRVAGDHYWSAEGSRSLWQFSSSANAFLRSAFNGNPLDANAGKTAKHVEKTGQSWSWNEPLGAFVKDRASRGGANGYPVPREPSAAPSVALASLHTLGLPTTNGVRPTPATGIDAFRADMGLPGTAAQQRSMISTPGYTQSLGSVATALPYGNDNSMYGGADDRWRTDNQCGDIASNASGAMNSLGINSGSVAISPEGTAPVSHAVVWMQNGTDTAGKPTFAYYDPQSSTFVDNGGAGYTSLSQGVSDLGAAAHDRYQGYGTGSDWAPAKAQGEGAVHTMDSPPYTGAGGRASDGTGTTTDAGFGWYKSWSPEAKEANANRDAAAAGEAPGVEAPPPRGPKPSDPPPADSTPSSPPDSEPSYAPEVPPVTQADQDAPPDSSPPDMSPPDTFGDGETSPPPPDNPFPESPPDDFGPGDFGGGDFGGGDFGGGDFGGGDFGGGDFGGGDFDF